jgi:hypothetical protein
MTLRSAVLSLTLAASATTAFAADANTFTLVNAAGKTIGKASYFIDKVKDGVRVRCKFQYRIAAGASQLAGQDADPNSRAGGALTTEAQYSGEYKISAAGDLLSGFLQNSANQMLTSFVPGKKGDILTVGQVQGGVNGGSRDLPLPAAHFLLAPNYDPSALQVLLTTALTQPHADSQYLLVVPAGSNPRAGDSALYVIIQPERVISASGTLAGKPLVLKHYLMNYHEGHADLYADADGTLMQADLGPLGASYIRTGFTLAP